MYLSIKINHFESFIPFVIVEFQSSLLKSPFVISLFKQKLPLKFKMKVWLLGDGPIYFVSVVARLLILNYPDPDPDQGLGGTRRDRRTNHHLLESSSYLCLAGLLL